MLVDFFLKLRAHGLPVTLRELLDLLRALEARVIHGSIDDFYRLARLCLVKDEAHYDRFDLAFKDFFEGIESLAELVGEVPYAWLRKEAERLLSDLANLICNAGYIRILQPPDDPSGLATSRMLLQ